MSIICRFRTALCVTLILSLIGCATPIRTYYAHSETILDTRHGVLGDNGLYHDVLYAPDVVALNFEGYIVGLDKSPRQRIGHSSDGDFYISQSQNGMAKIVSRLKDEPKSHYVSHIVWNAGKPYGDENCILHTTYFYKPTGNLFSPHLATLGSPCDKSLNEIPSLEPETAFSESFGAIEKLSSHMQSKLKSGSTYSHVLFVVMGWNTPQIEAVRNFNSIATNIRKASGSSEKFKPLFVGITWSSYWDQSWFDTLIKAASYPNKARDADEVGASWLGLLIERISSVTPQIPKIVIGHSFGARAASMAICMGSQFHKAFTPNVKFSAEPLPVPIDLFIGLQPAVSINRFLKGGGSDEIEYPESCDRAKRIVLTASSYDEALKSTFWADMAGVEKTRHDACGAKKSLFGRSIECITAEANGKTDIDSASITEDFVYVDASKLVFFQHPNTGGGSHSDIYRPETGAFMWQWFPAKSQLRR